MIPNPPSDSVIFEDLQYSAYSFTHGWDLSQGQDVKQNQQWDEVWEIIGLSLPGVLSVLNSSSNTLWQHLWVAVLQGRTLETLPRFFLVAGHIGTVWHIPRFQIQGRMQVVSINHIACTTSSGTASQPYQLWEWWEPAWNLSP